MTPQKITFPGDCSWASKLNEFIWAPLFSLDRKVVNGRCVDYSRRSGPPVQWAGPLRFEMSWKMPSWMQALTGKQALCALLVAALSFTINCLIALHRDLPQPRVQDEFSYLLAADTFAHGRLTNPTPPFPEHFESPHVLVQPTYMSKYPPGQGIFLALGQILNGPPIVGVWISSALATAAIYWMLLGFVQPPWALIGGILAAMHPQLLAWSQVYWGGSVAVLGGALLLGAWSRLMLQRSTTPTIVLAVGLVILANSRPYEGLILSIPILLSLILHRRLLVLPIAIVLIVAGAWMAYYNYRITGHPLRMPFMEYTKQYDIYPKFWFQPVRPTPQYSSPAIAAIHTDFERGDYDQLQTFRGVLKISAERVQELIWIHARLWLLLPLAASLFWREPRAKWIWITLGVFILGLCGETWLLPHYAAPATATLLLLIIVGLQKLWDWKAAGKIISSLAICGFLITAIIWAAAPLPPDALRYSRANLIADYPQLQTGRHLIFVQYDSGHLLHDEWVYNDADPQHSNIIWARALGTAADAPVIQYFHDRQTWLLRVGKTQVLFDHY
jgi:hypothetical protein